MMSLASLWRRSALQGARGGALGAPSLAGLGFGGGWGAGVGIRTKAVARRQRRSASQLKPAMGAGSWAGRFRKALLALDGGITDPYRLVLEEPVIARDHDPAARSLLSERAWQRIARETTPPARLAALVEEKLASTDKILRFYQAAAGTLPERPAVMLAVAAWGIGRPREACEILLDNMGMDRVIEAFCSSLIPTYSDADGLEFVVQDVVYVLVGSGQTQVAVQVLEELALRDSSVGKWRATAVRDAHTVVDSERAVEMSDGFGDDTDASTRARSVLDDESAGLWLKAQLCGRAMNADVAFSSEVFANASFVSSPGVLRALLKQVASKDLALAWSAFIRSCSYELADAGLRVLPLLAPDGRTLTRLWKDYRHYVRQGLGRELRRSPVLDAFLSRAVTLGQSITCTQIIKDAQGELDAGPVSYALQTVMWGKRRLPQPSTDDDVYRDPDDEDTALVQRIVNACPPWIVSDAICRVLRRLDAQHPQGIPGRILWNLVAGVEQSESLAVVPPSVERVLGRVIVKRPRLEQLRYMSLAKVTPDGVMRVVEAAAQASPGVLPEGNMKLLLMGLVIVKEKVGTGVASTAQQLPTPARRPLHDSASTSAHTAPATPTLHTSAPTDVAPYVSRLVLRLFQKDIGLDEVNQLVEFLHSTHLRPADDAIIRGVGVLAHRKLYSAAVQLLKAVPAAPPAAFHRVLARSARDQPQITLPLLAFARKQNIGVPSGLLRRIALNFAQSPHLTDSQTIRRIAIANALLRARHQNLGPAAATALVEAVIARADRRGRGSLDRLDWALSLARTNGVDQTILARWSQDLVHMRAARRGFWARRP